jgi:two-component system, NtrC family, sensor kinase
MNSKDQKKTPFSIGIVGGGRACKFFLDLLTTTSFPYLNIKVLWVCDINPDAQGMVLARELGILTVESCQDLFEKTKPDAVIELTNHKNLPKLTAMRPDSIGIVEYVFGRLLRKLFEMNLDLIKVKEQATLDKRYYNVLFQQTNLGVVVLDTNFNIVDANESYLKEATKNKEDILGKKCYEVFKGFYAPCHSENLDFDCPLIKTLDTGKTAHTIHDYVKPDGEINYFSIATYPIRDRNNKINHIVELWQDITSEIAEKWENKVKKIHSDMKKIIQEDRLVALGKLVASSVHEINNPIQGLLTFSHIIEDMTKKDSLNKTDVEQLREFNSHMSRELARCGNIVSGLLAFSRESALEFVNTDINDILTAVISLTGHKLELSDIKLNASLSKSPLIVHADRNQLQQCFLNIIFNAIDALPEGGEVHIKSAVGKDKKTVWVEISDDGYGITKIDMEHIFDPFFTTKEEGGTGLGLSIVYGIVKDHNGDIRAKSSPDKGTSFVISFPHVESN